MVHEFDEIYHTLTGHPLQKRLHLNKLRVVNKKASLRVSGRGYTMTLPHPPSRLPAEILVLFFTLAQDLDHVLRTDAANLGMEVEAKRERSEKLLAKAGDGELRALQRRSGDGEKVATVQDAQALQAKVSNDVVW